MDVVSEETIKKNIENYIRNNSNDFSKWYVGISAQPGIRLEIQHKVKDTYIIRKSASIVIARRVEDYFLKNKKTKGGPSGGDHNSVYVYAYKITPYTKQ